MSSALSQQCSGTHSSNIFAAANFMMRAVNDTLNAVHLHVHLTQRTVRCATCAVRFELRAVRGEL